MRVLHVAAGNLWRRRAILEEIARHGQSGHGFALSFGGRLSDSLSAAGATLHSLGPVRFSRPLSLWRARRRLSDVLDGARYDLVLGHSPWAYAVAAPIAEQKRIRRVLWAHDALDGRHWTERRVTKRPPDLVVCNSVYTARAISGWLRGIRTEVIYAPVSPFVSDPDTRCLVRRELGASESTAIILMASRLERWKGHADLIQAAPSLRGDWTIWIAGGPQRLKESPYARELRQIATSQPCGDRIHFLGERTDVNRLLRAADIHCQPNTAPEPFGVAFIEALYAGVPVVTSDAGGAREIVTPECGILVAPGDRAALSAALQTLIDDPSKRRALADGGPARARALCDPAAQMAVLERALA
jgi:glycosyltransferase involved in cell wall biosynthesis